MEESQKHYAEPSKSDTRIYTVLVYLHKVHQQPNYSLVIEIGTVVAKEGRLTRRAVRKLSG